MNAVRTIGRSASTAWPTVISGLKTESGGSMRRPIVPSGYCVLRLHCSTTSGGAEAWRKRRAPLSRPCRMFWTIAGLSSSSASTASAGWTRSRTAAASAGGSARICVASAEPARGTASLGFSTIWLKAHLPGFFDSNALCRAAIRLFGLQAEALPDGGGRARLVERVEVKPRRPGREEAVAELRDDVEAEGFDGGAVVAEALELQAHPARQLRPAGIGKARELREIVDRHDARDDRDVDAHRLDLLHEIEIRVGIVEVLRDRGVRPRIDLGLECREALLRPARPRMVFRIARDLDVEPVARLLADETHQVRGVAEFPGHRESRGHVAAQRDDVADVVRAVLRDHLAQALARRGDAREVRRGGASRLADLEHGGERALARRAPCPVRH